MNANANSHQSSRFHGSGPHRLAGIAAALLLASALAMGFAVASTAQVDDSPARQATTVSQFEEAVGAASDEEPITV